MPLPVNDLATHVITYIESAATTSFSFGVRNSTKLVAQGVAANRQNNASFRRVAIIVKALVLLASLLR